MNENDVKLLKEWEFILRNISDFVVVKRINEIRFIIKTNENTSHHRPHLHVETSSAAMSINIEDGEIIAKSGKISPVQIKRAKEWIKSNKGFISEKWNELSNGIKIQM